MVTNGSLGAIVHLLLPIANHTEDYRGPRACMPLTPPTLHLTWLLLPSICPSCSLTLLLSPCPSSLLALPDGKAALEVLASSRSSLHLRLAAFLPTSPKAAEQASSLRIPPPVDLGASRLWRAPPSSGQEGGAVPLRGAAVAADNPGYNSWVCCLTSALLTNCKDLALRLLCVIARLKTPVCELLLPEALCSLCTSAEVADESPQMRGVMASALQQHVLSGGRGAERSTSSGSGGQAGGGTVPDPRAVRLVLACLGKLRG